ncbi:hypothetical protein LWI29_020039 [Acer saccharum]|uniref:Uncharacterized protein n=1 Tax=Acer saccharum TaxID=4024 RepID=A0AA39W243_ACESA|nr:hypothetical protein LWI29_020039 [Acer saccharum]
MSARYFASSFLQHCYTPHIRPLYVFLNSSPLLLPLPPLPIPPNSFVKAMQATPDFSSPVRKASPPAICSTLLSTSILLRRRRLRFAPPPAAQPPTSPPAAVRSSLLQLIRSA